MAMLADQEFWDGEGTVRLITWLHTAVVGGFLAIALVIALVLPAVLGAYTVFAARARSRLTRPGTVRWVQRGTGAVMAGAAIAVATR